MTKYFCLEPFHSVGPATVGALQTGNAASSRFFRVSLASELCGLASPRYRPGLLVVVVSLVGIRWLLRTKPSDPASVAPFPQIEVPSPAADPNAALPHISETQPAITTVREMARPWSHRQFFYRKGQTGENIPALLIRLPSSSPAQPAGYWALSMQAPSGNCNLEYIRDWKTLKTSSR